MDLVAEIMKQAGVDEAQAKGGLGVLFKVAREKMDSADFSRIAGAVPGLEDFIRSVPASSGLAGMLGGMAKSLGGGSLGSLADLAGSLSQLKLDKDTISKFVPVVLEYLKEQGLDDLVGKIKAAVPGI